MLRKKTYRSLVVDHVIVGLKAKKTISMPLVKVSIAYFDRCSLVRRLSVKIKEFVF